MSILGATPLPADNHLEFWARTANDDIARLSTIYETTARGRIQTMINGELIDPRGFVIVPAITMADQCMIDDKGNLMTTAGAWKPTVVFDTPQTPDEIAAQVRTRISQVTSPSNCDTQTPKHCGRQMNDLYAIVSYTPTKLDPIAANEAPADRLAKCKKYWQDPLAYTPNPFQLPNPINGPLWGFVSYTTLTPPSGFDTLRLDIPIKLKGIKELFITIEDHSAARVAMFPPDGVNPKDRGPLYLQGFPGIGGNEAVFFDMAGTAATATATMWVNLDEDTYSF